MRANCPSIPLLALLLLACLLAAVQARAQSSTAALEPGTARVVEIEQIVEAQRAGSKPWDPSRTNQVLYPGDQLRTGQRSRAAILLSDLTVLRLGELSHIQIPETKKRSGLNFFQGIFYFFHRDKPGEFELRTPTVSAVVRGTEFNLKVAEDKTTTLMLLDGQVEMTNQFGQLSLLSGQGGIAEPNQAPRRTAMIEAINIIQWSLYYPAVLDTDELRLTRDEEQAVSDSLSAYRSGDLLAALAKYPPDRQPASAPEKVYRAALVLAVGKVDEAQELLAGVQSPKSKVQGPESVTDRAGRLADALRTIVAAVKSQITPSTTNAEPAKLATEWLAESYYQQARTNLPLALASARHAADQAPKFAFAWERVAELEFSFGHIENASEALDKSLALAPRNAQALALKGFLLSARNRIPDAITYFDQAIAVDGALGDAWLGRGLCQIRQGKTESGRRDLEVAATLEPQRAALRSYLAKAFSNAGDNRRASQEIRLAKQLDINDPTAWLYSALILQQQQRINQAVEDLEKSQQLNENRRVYRSQLLLDQDRAVRGANLAAIYQDAGMTEVSVREAARAVNVDYANYSAHLFLANSYDALRDPRQINLRYETPWLSEYLVANLLAPVGAGTLSPYVTQQEYARLLERDRLGFFSSTEYLSRGDWIENASLFGSHGNSSFAADVAYRSENGQRPNNELQQLTVSGKVKQQLTLKDGVYFQAIYYDAAAGDVTPYYNVKQFFNPTENRYLPGPNLGLRTKENQEPIVLAGYHHEWSPGNHTLFLAGRLQDTFRVNNTNFFSLVTGPVIGSAVPVPLQQDYRSSIEIYSAEAQQIFQRERQALVLGARYQGGEFRTRNTNALTGSVVFPAFTIASTDLLTEPPAQDARSDFARMNFYGYYHLQAADPGLPVHFIAGLSYDRLMFPENFRFAPISSREKTIDQVSPKLGLIWTPWPDTTVRAAWSRSLGGASIDQSFQLEPSQVAGFNQAWRSIIPESVAGANAGARFENWDLALDQKFPTRTYVGIVAEVLKSRVDRLIGILETTNTSFAFPLTAFNSGTPEKLDYQEKSLSIALNQLISEEWSLGARYRISEAELRERLPALSTFLPSQDLRATLNQAHLFALFNHPSGFFSQFESLWFSQNNRGYNPNIPGEDFWQFNIFAGYRFPRRRAEITLGILNLADRDYRLNPLNLTTELPRTRTFYASLRFSF